MVSLLKNQYLAIIWGIIVLILCDMPMPEGGQSRFFEGFDKLVHTGFFFVLTVLLFRGSIKRKWGEHDTLVTIGKVLLAASFFGGLIEILQLEVFTYRSAEWWDFFADVVGVGMGIFSYLFLHTKKGYEKRA